MILTRLHPSLSVNIGGWNSDKSKTCTALRAMGIKRWEPRVLNVESQGY